MTGTSQKQKGPNKQNPATRATCVSWTGTQHVVGIGQNWLPIIVSPCSTSDSQSIIELADFFGLCGSMKELELRSPHDYQILSKKELPTEPNTKASGECLSVCVSYRRFLIAFL